MNTSLPDDKKNKTVKVPVWLFVVILLAFLAITFAVLYLRFIRYMLVGESITNRDITSTALLLTPEITAGLARLF
jgi:hypothetical protein